MQTRIWLTRLCRTYKEPVSHGYITGGGQPHSSSYVHRYICTRKQWVKGASQVVGNPIHCPTDTDTYVQGSSESWVHHRWRATPFIILRTQIHVPRKERKNSWGHSRQNFVLGTVFGLSWIKITSPSTKNVVWCSRPFRHIKNRRESQQTWV